jgi:hypothetical protein
MKFVVAGTYAEYIQHIHKMGYNKNEYVYVSDPIQLRGLTEIEGFFIGSYESRPGIEEIKQTISYIKSRSKIYKATASQTLPPHMPTTPFNSNGMGFEPTSVMLKNAGAWQIHDLKNDVNNGEVK